MRKKRDTLLYTCTYRNFSYVYITSVWQTHSTPNNMVCNDDKKEAPVFPSIQKALSSNRDQMKQKKINKETITT